MAGSIEKRGENTYRLVVSGGKNLDGTRCKKTKTIHGTRKDAEIALAEFITEVNRGLVPEGKSITFEEFFYIWDEKYASKELAPKTYSRYIGILKSRILPYLGSFPLDKIKPTDLMNFYDMLENDTQIKRIAKNNGQRTLKPLSPKTILEHHRLISAMLQNAVYWQILPYNPADRVKPPKHERPQIKYYDDVQCKQLLEALENEEIKFQTIVILTLFTGMRRGEVLGLEWSDIDFKEGFVHITKASQYTSDKGIFVKDPKTHSSIRKVGIPDIVINMLYKYKTWYDAEKEKCGDLWNNSNRLFVTWNGNPMHPDTVTDWFRSFIEKNNLPKITFHGLRHTNATLLISKNVDVAVVASRLGHAQITTTLNFYVHPVEAHNKEAGNVLEKMLV